MKKLLIILISILAILGFNGCTASNSKYKLLYEVQPEKESLKK
ncbi:hypothetical protein [Arcobacter sp. FWKO B]|nr:hypothetical protein [Arcobacter sp. FWKO B]